MDRSSLIAAAAAGLLAAGATSLGTAAGGNSGNETLRYTVRMELLSAHGPDQGDVHAFSGTLLRGTRSAGAYRGSCFVTDPGARRLQCSITADIRGRGQIVATGAVAAGGRGTMVVVGGTGDFRTARGTRTGQSPRTEGNEIVADLVFRLRGVRR